MGKRPSFAVSMTVFLVSAFWHGFYPSYYFCFFFAAILSDVNKDLFKSQILFKSYVPAFMRNFLAN